MRFLIIAHPGDTFASVVYALLKRRHGSSDVKVVTGQEISLATLWKHELDGKQVFTELILHDGSTIVTGEVAVIFNRIRWISVPHFAEAAEKDREYAQMEMTALWTSWLNDMNCPVVNPVTPRGLSGPEYSDIQWLAMATQYGIPVRRQMLSTNARFKSISGFEVSRTWAEHLDSHLLGRRPALFLEPLKELEKTVWVVGDAVLGTPEITFFHSLKEFAKAVRCPLLQFNLAKSASEQTTKTAPLWFVKRISPHIDQFNDSVIVAVADYLEAKARCPEK
jgi:hypothetical protein